MTKKSRNWLLAIFILAFPFALFCFFFFSHLADIPPAPAPLPNPNGYDNFVKAGKMLADPIPNYDNMSLETLRLAVSTNAAAVALARAGLSNQSRVPVQYSEAYSSNHFDDLAALKRLARAFIAEGRLAEIENRPADAAKSYLEAIHLGNKSMRGGVLIDGTVGVAIEGIGAAQLTNLVNQLDAKSCRESATALEALDAKRQTWDELMQQENAWSHATYRGWRYEYMRWVERKLTASNFAAIKLKFDAQEQKPRRLMLDLAARAYQLDKGHPPASAADLVPDYLKAVPQDPVTGKNLKLSP